MDVIEWGNVNEPALLLSDMTLVAFPSVEVSADKTGHDKANGFAVEILQTIYLKYISLLLIIVAD